MHPAQQLLIGALIGLIALFLTERGWIPLYKLMLWKRKKVTQPTVGQKWVFADLSSRWPPHSFEITKVTADEVFFTSNWITHEPDYGFKKLTDWDKWARQNRAFPL